MPEKKTSIQANSMHISLHGITLDFDMVMGEKARLEKGGVLDFENKAIVR